VLIITIIRVLIIITFLILAIGGPLALLLMRRYVIVVMRDVAQLEVRMDTMERRITRIEERTT
jgi:uncharacterized membrane-anchored protein